MVRAEQPLDAAEELGFEPAPSRGCYDRALSRPERQAQARQRLLAATASAFALRGEALNVGDVVELAGVGRNTFYEYFDDIRDARRRAAQRFERRATALLDEALGRSRTPFSQVRQGVRCWYEVVSEEPHAALLALAEFDAALWPVGMRPFERVLEAMAERPGVFASARDEVARCAALGAVLLLTRRAAQRQEYDDGKRTSEVLFRLLR